MDRKFLLVSLFSVLALPLFAQKLQVDTRPMQTEEARTADAWIAHLDQDVSYCIGTYSDFMKKTFSAKIDKRTKSVLSVNKTAFPEVSNLRIDQRAVFTPESSGSTIAFMFSPGYDIHFGQQLYSEEFLKGETFVKSYVRFHYKVFYNELIKDLNDKIKSKNKSINSNQTRIDKNNKAIKANEEDIAAGATGAEKMKEKNIKLTKENEELFAEIEKLNTEITNLNTEIGKANESLVLVEAYK